MIFGNYDADYLRTPEPADDDEQGCIEFTEDELNPDENET